MSILKWKDKSRKFKIKRPNVLILKWRGQNHRLNKIGES